MFQTSTYIRVVIVSFIVFLVAGIGIAQTPTPLPQTKPEKAGMSSDRLSYLGALMQDFIDQGKMSGIVVIALRKGEIVHYNSYGWRNIEENKAMQKDDLFRLFSMTKPIICSAALILMEEGEYLLNDPVSMYLPEFKNPKVYVEDKGGEMVLEDAESPIRIRHLFTHTSGFSYGTLLGEDNLYTKRFEDVDLFGSQQTLAEMVSKLADLPLRYQPGTTFNYSFSTDVLARLVEVLSGQSINEFLRERLFVPLEMKDTGYIIPMKKWDRMTTIYTHNPSGTLEVSSLNSDSFKNRRFFPGGHGLVSTAMDYARFSQMLLNKGELYGTRILSPKSVELMTSNFLRNENNATDFFDRQELGFGLGVQIVIDPVVYGKLWSKGTYGWSSYTNSYFFIDPEEELVGIFMNQLTPYNFEDVWDRYTNLLYQAILE